MLLLVFIVAAFSAEVQSQRCTVPTYSAYPTPYKPIVPIKDPYASPPILPCQGKYLPQTVVPIKATIMPVAVMPEPIKCAPEIAMPVTTMPVLPFISELPDCPDICLNEILTCPLGCLDAILTTYGTKAVCALPEFPVSPLLPAASPVSALTPPFSGLLPPACDCDCYSHYLKRVPIPPPFI